MRHIGNTARRSLEQALAAIVEPTDGTATPVVRGAAVVADALDPLALSALASSVFTRGDDLVSALGAIAAPHDEVIVGDADRKIPSVAGLRDELDEIVAAVLQPDELRTELQVRVYDGRMAGHPVHTDQQQDLTPTEHGWITSLSTSVPLQFPPGPALRFHMHPPGGAVTQDSLGSVGFFGPTVPHVTPDQPIAGRAIWLTGLTVLHFGTFREGATR